MELDHLAVLELGPRLVGQRRAVACALPRVRGHAVHAPRSAGGEQHGPRPKQEQAAVRAGVGQSAGDAPVAGQQAEDGDLHVDVDPTGVDQDVLQAADELQPGAVSDVGQARIGVGAEGPLVDHARARPVEHRAPALELEDPCRRLPGVDLRHPPVVDQLAALHGVGEVGLPAVEMVHVGERGGDAALGHHGVGLPEQRLADHGDRAAGLGGGDGPPHARPSGADHQDVRGHLVVALGAVRHQAQLAGGMTPCIRRRM